MLNLSIISLISLVLIYQNIIILNEEILILLCFITFCWVILIRLNKSISSDLKTRSSKIEDSLTNSLNQLLQILSFNIELQSRFKILVNNFRILGNHFLKFSSIINDKLPLHFIYMFESLYPKKLIFTQHLEQQTTKLLVLLLVQKLDKIILLQRFYTLDLNIPNFLCINKVILREYFEVI